MVKGDVRAGLLLCRAAGWNQTAEDWELFLELSPEGCCVAVDDEGQVRGTVSTVRYQDHFSWIGMVLVDPAFQRQGIGIQLLRESLQILSEENTVKLDATPAGRHIYLQLDFVDEYRISRMERKGPWQDALPLSPARPVVEKDLHAILELDRRVFGADRGAVIRSLLRRSRRLAFVSDQGEGIDGFCFGRLGHNFTQIGPVIAKTFEAAKNVASAALVNVADRPVVMDCLHFSEEWSAWVTSLGFVEQRPLIRMFRGTNTHAGLPENQFAILGPEFG